MKKIYAILLGLLFLMTAVTAVAPWGMPGEEFVPGAVPLEEDRLLVAENRAFTSRLYTMEEGQVSEIYHEFRLSGGEETNIAHVALFREEPLFIRVSEDGRNWEVVHLEDGNPKTLHNGVFEDQVVVTGLAAEDQQIWITAVGTSGAIFIYECKEDTSISMVIPPWWLRDVISAEFDGKVIRATTSFGEHCTMTVDNFKTFTDSPWETPVPELSVTGVSWLLCKVWPLLATLLMWLVVAATVLISARICRRGRQLATRLAAVGAEVLLLAILSAVIAAFFLMQETAGLAEALRGAAIIAGISAAIWAAGLGALLLVSRGLTSPLKTMSHQMKRISEGNVQPQVSMLGQDELAKMDSSIQEMCMDLSIRNYELQATIASYQRFVPSKLPELLDRASVAEVTLGDNRRITGNVGYFAIGNRTDARNVLKDDDFVQFINRTTDMMQTCITNNNGYMISSGQLSTVEILFPEDPVDGVRAGLDFVGRAAQQNMEGIPAPRPFLMLHNTSFLYGVSGQENRMFPFFSSGELEFLGSLSSKFHETGTRIVMTETYWKQLEDAGFTARYIGFVSDGDWGPYKLYELLDAYSELDKQLRISYDQRLQEAINLFYHNDFYLARNLFSTLLRVCPADGIIRWYLFACEHFFNLEGEQEPDYRLFGLRDV